jgi:dUTP pyrophosphatase
MLKVKKFKSEAFLPIKTRIDDAGWDLSSVEDIIIPPQSWKLVDTGIGIIVPNGTYGRIAPRSGVSTKGISVNAGVIDKNYRGKCKVLLVNHSTTNDFIIEKGDRIAQLILEKIIDECEIVEVDDFDETNRGESGFGSSGIKNV